MASIKSPIQIVFGGANILEGNDEQVAEWLDLLEQSGIKIIDTAAMYGKSEELLGNVGAAKRFTIDTKLPGAFSPEPSTKDVIIAGGKESLKKLKCETVDVLYLHCPDHRVPVKETLSVLNELYKAGAFKRLGVSNYLAEEVEEMVRVAKENNFVVPSVYQGNYNAVARLADTEIFPTIRKHGMAYYAYSPIAGGFLSKSKATLIESEGRFGSSGGLAGQIYNAMYNRGSFLDALDVWEQIAKDEKITRSELAYRWVVYHSMLDATAGDAIIVGARNVQQLKETVGYVRAGPLSDAAVKKIDEIWARVKADAVLDNYQMVKKSQMEIKTE